MGRITPVQDRIGIPGGGHKGLMEVVAGQSAVDVFVEEPLPEDSPFWELENLIITSHYSGLTPHYAERGMAIFLDNLRRYHDGKPLRNRVSRELGY